MVWQAALLKVMNHSGLLEAQATSMLQQKLALRAPYVTPLNVLQVPLTIRLFIVLTVPNVSKYGC